MPMLPLVVVVDQQQGIREQIRISTWNVMLQVCRPPFAPSMNGLSMANTSIGSRVGNESVWPGGWRLLMGGCLWSLWWWWWTSIT